MAYIEDMPGALASADFAISRAGAMSLAELCAWGIPAILVPLPSAAANHQHHNAVALADAGAALMVPESELGQGRLWRDMMELAKDPARRAEIAAKARERGKPDAADRIAGELLRLVKKS
jgi:UDP-N-acetylglucosamine--N-acetylmuramyl-(pentapeptide) pyrophosphoryl-undecaprenol N-acetylglucosamine transferase